MVAQPPRINCPAIEKRSLGSIIISKEYWIRSIQFGGLPRVGVDRYLFIKITKKGLQLFKYNQDLNNNLKELKEYDMFTSNSTFFAIIQT